MRASIGLGTGLLLVGLAALSGCGGDDGTSGDDSATGWRGSIETAVGVTTVMNESGSVWGGRARLVEEASIGLETGPEEYLFAFIRSLHANGERIVVADDRTRSVRVYDRSGAFLFDVGRQGQGPGEFVTPAIVALDGDGRVFLFDSVSDRLSEFAASGEFLTSRQVNEFGCCAWGIHPRGQGLLWMPIEEPDPDDPREGSYGARLYTLEDGPVGEPLRVPEIEFERTVYHEDAGRPIATPFSPRLVWAPTPDGGIVAGASDRYRFEILRPDGSRTVVHHHAEPAPVSPEEWEWNRRVAIATRRQYEAGFDWDGAEMPRQRRAYEAIMGAVSGEIWVRREAGSERVPDCAEDPLEESPRDISRFCFRPVYALDVFGADGRFLGQVEVPPEMRPSNLYIDGNVVVGVEEDELGVLRVKRYRLVRSGTG